MKKRFFLCFLIICLILGGTLSVNAFEITEFEVPARNVLLASLDTKEILYSKAPNEKIYPASITKLMTAAVILDRFPNLDTPVTMTQTAYNRILGTGSAVLEAKVGEVFDGKDALAAVLVSSAGDVVYAYAEAAYGSVEAFVEQMNIKAEQLGLNDTHYENPIGLHHQENYTTVNDIYTLSLYVLENYPIISEITSKSRYTMNATNMSDKRLLVTTNYMIDANTVYYYPYCTGLKTGFTDESGRCLVSTASYDGYNYIAITMNCPTVAGERTEFTLSRQLYRWAFLNFEYKSVLDTSLPATEIKVNLSFDSDYVSLYPSTQIRSILPKEADNSTIIVKPNLIAESVNAPIKKGDVLGTAEVVYAEQVIGTVDLVAGNDVKVSGLLVVFDAIKRFFASSFFKAVLVVVIGIIVFLVLYTIYINTSHRKKKRKVKYMPYDEEKEERRKEKLTRRRKEQGRPEANYEDFNSYDTLDGIDEIISIDQDDK